MIIFGNIPHPVTISTVTANQKFIILTDGSTNHGFYTIGSASLQKDRCILFRIAGSNADQLFTQCFDNVQIIVFIPCTPVGHHGFLYSL